MTDGVDGWVLSLLCRLTLSPVNPAANGCNRHGGAGGGSAPELKALSFSLYLMVAKVQSPHREGNGGQWLGTPSHAPIPDLILSGIETKGDALE